MAISLTDMQRRAKTYLQRDIPLELILDYANDATRFLNNGDAQSVGSATYACKPLRVRGMEKSVIYEGVDSGGKRLAREITLPVDFLEAKTLVGTKGTRFDYESYANYKQRAEGPNSDFTAQQYASSYLPTNARAIFTTYNDKLFTYNPHFAGEGVELLFYAKLPDYELRTGLPIGDNWVAENSPHLYWRAAVAMAADSIKDTGQFAKHWGSFCAGVNAVNSSHHSAAVRRAGVARVYMRPPGG